MESILQVVGTLAAVAFGWGLSFGTLWIQRNRRVKMLKNAMRSELRRAATNILDARGRVLSLLDSFHELTRSHAEECAEAQKARDAVAALPIRMAHAHAIQELFATSGTADLAMAADAAYMSLQELQDIREFFLSTGEVTQENRHFWCGRLVHFLLVGQSLGRRRGNASPAIGMNLANQALGDNTDEAGGNGKGLDAEVNKTGYRAG